MGRRNDSKPTAAGRQSQISRTLSKLLRHQAQNERVPITKEGWVRMDDLLAWSGLSKGKFNPVVRLSDIFDVVEDDGQHGKGRFGLRLVDDSISGDVAVVTTATAAATTTTSPTTTTLTTAAPVETQPLAAAAAAENESSKNSPETISVLEHFSHNPHTAASAYLIRATQGHSMKTVESKGLLAPITLDDLTTLPEVVVHGTFYGAWDAILTSGGLKPMGRNMVHFATGPSMAEVLPGMAVAVAEPSSTIPAQNSATNGLKSKKDVDAMLSKNKIVSGMRWDAQILIYIDLPRLLRDVQEKNWTMQWFRSDNGVILTAGVVVPATSQDGPASDPEVKAKTKTEISSPTPLVPISYFSHVVDIKSNLGLLYTHSQGIVTPLPAHLRNKALPSGKGKDRGKSAGAGQRPKRTENPARTRGGPTTTTTTTRKPDLYVEKSDYEDDQS